MRGSMPYLATRGQVSASELIRLFLEGGVGRIFILDDEGVGLGFVGEEDVLGKLGASRVATGLRQFMQEASSEQWRFWNVRVLSLKAADFIPAKT